MFAMQLNWLLGLIPKLSKLLGIAWNPFLVSTHQLLARGYSQDCYLNCLLPLKLMEEISQDLDWYHNQYQTSRVHLILRKTLITVQHQMYALPSAVTFSGPAGINRPEGNPWLLGLSSAALSRREDWECLIFALPTRRFRLAGSGYREPTTSVLGQS